MQMNDISRHDDVTIVHKQASIADLIYGREKEGGNNNRTVLRHEASLEDDIHSSSREYLK
jgi:hypothetical protein